MKNNKNRVVLIGAGNVGLSYAYALVNQKNSVDEFRIIDINEDKLLGEVEDLNHGLCFSPNKLDIRVGSYEDVKYADLVVICAGASQKKNETRLDLVNKNNIIFKDIITKVIKNEFKGIFLVATNPVDIMTYQTFKFSGFDKNKVIGTGTILDTARLRYMLSKKLDIDVKNIHGYVLGEHGDSEFIPWSNVTFGTENITDHLEESNLEEIEKDVMLSAYRIIDKKGSTHYGIGMCLVRITNAIFNNEHSILSISSFDEENNLYYGNPTVIGRDGIIKRLDMSLITSEKAKLKESIKVIKESIDNINK